MRARFTMLAMLLTCCLLLLLGCGCVSFQPPPSTQPTSSNPVVERYYQVRGGYLNALLAGTASRLLPEDSSLHMSDPLARETEAWRAIYVVTVLDPHRLAADPYIDFLERVRIDDEQRRIEERWKAALPPGTLSTAPMLAHPDGREVTYAIASKRSGVPALARLGVQRRLYRHARPNGLQHRRGPGLGLQWAHHDGGRTDPVKS